MSFKGVFGSIKINDSKVITDDATPNLQSANDDLFHLPEQIEKTKSRVFQLRGCLIVCLLLACILCGYFGYQSMAHEENEVFSHQYQLMANKLKASIVRSVNSQSDIAAAMAKIVGSFCPSSHVWPYCYIPIKSYSGMAQEFKIVSESTILGFAPIVYPSQVEHYENFSYSIFESDPYFPTNTGISSFGRGISAMNATINPTGDNRYHDTSGVSYCSERTLLTPIFELYPLDIYSFLVMYNLHSLCERSIPMDQIMNCVDSGFDNCTYAASDFVVPMNGQLTTIMFSPIFPTNSPHQLVGFAGATFSWDTFLTGVVPSYSEGIDCVIHSDRKTFTYRISDGTVSLKGDVHDPYRGYGDLHEKKFSSYKVSTTITPNNSLGSQYSIDFYPSQALRDHYKTWAPLIVGLGSVAIIVLISILLFGYDYLMRNEAMNREIVLASKRKFVKFISHEIRTPMNIVCLGLKYLEGEMTLLEIAPDEPTNKMEECKKLIQDMYDSSQTAVVVLNDLINYDKIEMKTLVIEKKPLQLKYILQKSLKYFEDQTLKSGIMLSYPSRISDFEQANANIRKLRVIGDDIKLNQVFRNLFGSTLALCSPDSAILVSERLIDRGNNKMVDAEFANNFSPHGWYRVEIRSRRIDISSTNKLSSVAPIGSDYQESATYHGCGLGLWISKGIVEQHRGTLTSFHDSEKRIVFVVELPVVECLNDDFLNDSVSRSRSRLRSLGSNLSMSTSRWMEIRTVLIVDDVELNRKILCRILRSQKLICNEAVDGVDCISKVLSIDNESNREKYDLILIDYEMPNMNGPEAVKRLRHAGCKAMIIGVTGNSSAEEMQLFKDCGANDVLVKPISLEMLKEACNSCFM